MSTDVGTDRSRKFPFRARTNRQTRLNALPHAGGYVVNSYDLLCSSDNVSWFLCLSICLYSVSAFLL